MEIRVEGANQLLKLQKDLKAAGSDLRKGIPKAMREAAKPMTADIRASAAEVLPHRGGLAARIAKISVRVSTRRDGVRLVGRRTKSGGLVDVAALNAGRARHLVYGHKPWVSQSITPGFWDKGVDKNIDEIRAQLLRVIDDVRRKFAAGGR